jgi:hypothetical protein
MVVECGTSLKDRDVNLPLTIDPGLTYSCPFQKRINEPHGIGRRRAARLSRAITAER